MTRTTCFSAVSFAALVAALTTYGCGSSSTGTTSGTGGATTIGGSGGSAAGQGGAIGGGVAGAFGGLGGAPGGDGGATGEAGAPGGDGGATGGGTAGATGNTDGGRMVDARPPVDGRPVVDAGPAVDARPGMDAGPAMCVANAMCMQGFTCREACMVGAGANAMQGTRACTCRANGTLNCPAGAGTCMIADAGVTPPPPVDAGRPACMAGIVSGVTPCMLGVPECMRTRMMVTQTCSCGAAADGGAGARDVWTCL
jgi:hypothetical protein